MGMRAQGAGDEPESADKEDQHDEGVEKTSGAKIDVHVGEHAREDEERTCKSENPARCAATVPEEQTHAEKHGDQGHAESVRAEKLQKERFSIGGRIAEGSWAFSARFDD